MRLIHLYAPEDVVLFLVGNKSDLADKRKVSRQEAEQYAASIGADYGEASALTGSDVDECMFRFTEKVMKKNAAMHGRLAGRHNRLGDPSRLSGAQVAKVSRSSSSEKEKDRACKCF